MLILNKIVRQTLKDFIEPNVFAKKSIIDLC